jgi:DNA repair exonuclease SbcCD ATPase subunit
MKLDDETVRTGMLAREINDLRENFTRERAAFEGKLESVASSMADLQACVEELTEEKNILKAKNETLENEKEGLIEKLIEISKEFDQDRTIRVMEMMRMRKDSDKKRIMEAETYTKKLEDVQAKFCATAQKLKEENAELITKNSVAQAALIEKAESLSLAVPQMMQDLVRNLSKQATDFKDGCASLTANIKESPREEIGESKA